jgi:hypothetical protein
MSKTAGKQNQPAGKQGDVRLWLQRPSQKVHETEAATPTGQHIRVTLERTSTGGTRHEAHFERAASGPMSAAERAKKKRVRASLFPEEHTEKMAKESSRKRSERTRDDIQAAADDPAADKVVADAAAERMRADAAAADAAELSRIKVFLLEKYGVQPDELQQLVDRARGGGNGDSDVEETGFSEGTGAVGAGAAREVAVNRAAVAAHGLPCFTVPYRRCEHIPQSLYDRKFVDSPDGSKLCMRARIVDFWPGSKRERTALEAWLDDICCLTYVTDDRLQVGPACGYVAARATNLMYAAADSMAAVDLSDAADEKWIRLGNQVLQNSQNEAVYLETQEVYRLIEAFREHDSTAGKYMHTGRPVSEKIPFRPIPAHEPQQYTFASMQWPVTVGSLDWVARKIVEAVMGYVTAPKSMWEQHLFVMNIDESGEKGRHWIAIGIELETLYFEGRTAAGERMYGYGEGRTRPLGAIGT